MHTFGFLPTGLRFIGIFKKIAVIVTRFAFYYSFLLIALPNLLKAQDSLPPILHYDMRDGLSQMKTTSILKDPLGYIWIGTRNGLNRFDGKQIVSYSRKDGLPHDRIHDLALDSAGRLLILTYKGISVFDGANFDNIPADFLNAEYKMTVDAYSRTWIMSYDETSLFWNDKLERFSHPVIQQIAIDEITKETYLFSNNTIYTYQDPGFREVRKGNFRKPENLVLSNNNHLFFEKTGQNKPIQACVMRDASRICFESPQEYLTLHPESHIYQFNSRGHFFIFSQNDTLTINESPFIRVVDVFTDEFGNSWLADENGFSVIQNSPFRHYSLRELPYVWTVNQDLNGDYWAASFGYGLKRSRDGLNFERVHEAEKVTKSPYFLAASTRCRHGTLYFGHSNGLLTWDGRKFQNIIDRQPVYAVVCHDHSSDIFIGGIQGVQRISPNGDVLNTLDHTTGLHENEYIQNLSIDRDGNLWAGSYTGVSRISPDLNTCINYTPENGRLPGSGVYCSYTDDQGITWMGGDEGLLWYDSGKDSICHVQSAVLNSMVKSITRLNRDHLLIGAKNGVYLFDTQRFLQEDQIDLQVLNQSNGYQGLEPGFTGFFKDTKGDIWICSASSLDVLTDRPWGTSDEVLRPVITLINDVALPFLGKMETVHLLRGESSVRIRADAVGVVRPQEVAFQYRLDGGDWSAWKPDPQFVFNEISHGTHHFELRTGPTDLPPNLTPTVSLDFIIDLPFYKRQAFPVIAFFTVLSMMGIALFLYIRQRYENQRYIRQLAASKFLRSQLLLSELNPHFIFNILSSIQHKVLLGDREQAAGYVVKLSRMIRNFLTASHQSHRNLENYRENDISLEKELELLKSYIEFEQLKSDGHFDYYLEIDPEILPSQVFVPPMLIQPFVENAIKHGLLLHSEKGKLSIKIFYLKEDLTITVEDDGVGRERAAEMKGDREGHVSLGTLIIDQRIELLNQLGYRLHVITEDVSPAGTRVIITLKE